MVPPFHVAIYRKKNNANEALAPTHSQSGRWSGESTSTGLGGWSGGSGGNAVAASATATFVVDVARRLCCCANRRPIDGCREAAHHFHSGRWSGKWALGVAGLDFHSLLFFAPHRALMISDFAAPHRFPRPISMLWPTRVSYSIATMSIRFVHPRDLLWWRASIPFIRVSETSEHDRLMSSLTILLSRHATHSTLCRRTTWIAAGLKTDAAVPKWLGVSLADLRQSYASG